MRSQAIGNEASAYEALGQPSLALEQYRDFLAIWKDADKDQSELVDARERAEALEAAGSM